MCFHLSFYMALFVGGRGSAGGGNQCYCFTIFCHNVLELTQFGDKQIVDLGQ